MRARLSLAIFFYLCSLSRAQVDVESGEVESVQSPRLTGVAWAKSALPNINLTSIFSGNGFNVKKAVMERGGNAPIKIAESEGDFFISGEKEIASFNDASKTFSMSAPTMINTPLSISSGVTSNNLPEWYLYSLNTFENGSSSEGFWRPREFSTCGTSSDTFLGGHCKFGATQATGLYPSLPSHKEVKVKARVHFFDQWEGQSLYLKAGNTIIWTKSWSWCPKHFSQECAKRGIDSCGHSYPDRISAPLEISFSHSLPFLALTFESTLPSDNDPCVASWGVDDIEVYLR